jgi:hypothetical protein
MKKLALAPAVAIAITGLAASPVIAAPGSVNYSHSVVKNSGDAQESTAPESPKADAQAIEAEVTTSPKEITAEDLANKDKGIVVTITGLEAGDKISDSLTGEAGTAEGDTFEYNIYSTQPAEDIENGTVDFSVTITRDGEQRTYDGLSFNVGRARGARSRPEGLAQHRQDLAERIQRERHRGHRRGLHPERQGHRRRRQRDVAVRDQGGRSRRRRKDLRHPEVRGRRSTSGRRLLRLGRRPGDRDQLPGSGLHHHRRRDRRAHRSC